ncbi:MAG TPA: hypothetical protein EYO97_01705, partial [Gemmatimonadetes bacterium]|nr:hypothetical protein [Gemmatimonadota bacterium]
MALHLRLIHPDALPHSSGVHALPHLVDDPGSVGVRNDLGRVASAGSVEVATAAELESFSSVHHLVGVV